ncbi:MAG: N-acetyl-gamma-glutamyl-phosphate reductase [Verrucomicrobia bacterium]|nr:MAG: N-acetyl-gamma-glutamyl-phosphate reductase [Verrucomicrobiota bacterium]
MIRAKIVGAGGYGGVGITELLLRHPQAQITCLVSLSDVGLLMSEVYPHLTGFCDTKILAPDDSKALEPADVVFFATPDGVGQEFARAELAKGAKVIDYSGDFRFDNTNDYAEYARRIKRDPVHKAPELLPESVYGLPELRRTQYRKATRLVGNPGCFAMSCLLGLAPAVKHKLVDLTSLICDCKTAVSGAGKKPNAQFHYPARYDQMNAYRLAGHQHTIEVERDLSLLAGKPVQVTFTAQVVPMCRGIMSCLYGTLRDGITPQQVQEAYREFNKDNVFVRLFDRNAAIGTVHVRGTNYCNLTVDVDERTRRLRVVSHIDNLMKGQASNALQNMNLLFSLPETTGLDQAGQYP